MAMPSAAFQKLRSRTAPLAKTALLRSGAYSAVRYLLPSRSAAILRYHAICGAEGHAYADPAICISPGAFEQHAAYLAAEYTVLPLPEIVDRLRNRRPLPRNCVAITFDDGYADNLEAARVLNRHQLTATFYITAGCMAGGEPFWPSELRALIGATPGPQVCLSTGSGSVDIPIGTAAERRKAVGTLTRLFKANPISVRERLREQLRRAAGQAGVTCHMLRWDEINYNLDHAGYVFSSITPRLTFSSHFLSGESIYIQYSRYRYGDEMVLAGKWPWGTQMVAGSDIVQGGSYTGDKPDMDVVKIQATVAF